MGGTSSARPRARRGRGASSRDPQGPRPWAQIRPELEDLLEIELPADLYDPEHLIDDARSVAQLLRELLERKLLPKGKGIAGERLAELLRLHRNTMSKVFQVLAEEGYLQRRRGRSPVVAAHRNVLPKRHTRRVSHTALAEHYGLAVRTKIVSNKRKRIADLAPKRAGRVADRLELAETAEVLVHSRIRELREPGGVWVPAIAETAYFAVLRAPSLVDALAVPGRVNSLLQFLEQIGIDPVTGAYEVRASYLPDPFLEPWAAMSKLPLHEVATLPFLRFESTTHGHVGAIEFSVAYLHKDFFSLATTDVVLEIKPMAVLAAAKTLAGEASQESSVESERPLRPQTGRRAAR